MKARSGGRREYTRDHSLSRRSPRVILFELSWKVKVIIRKKKKQIEWHEHNVYGQLFLHCDCKWVIFTVFWSITELICTRNAFISYHFALWMPPQSYAEGSGDKHANSC